MLSSRRRVLARLRALFTRRRGVRVRVFYNQSPAFSAYRHADPVRLIVTVRLAIDAGVPDDEVDRVVLERVFAACNGHPLRPGDRVDARLPRAMSVGDLAAVADRWYACDPVGWRPVPAPRRARVPRRG
ncbi:hypothetical protein [Nocardia puris]|uniref:hypothetical protein n=1 Tax=Nocardia puris TaxID=208602 RepID=UPI002E20F762